MKKVKLIVRRSVDGTQVVWLNGHRLHGVVAITTNAQPGDDMFNVIMELEVDEYLHTAG